MQQSHTKQLILFTHKDTKRYHTTKTFLIILRSLYKIYFTDDPNQMILNNVV
jgi:hypothetical protein